MKVWRIFKMIAMQESQNAVFRRFVKAISDLDCATLGDIASQDVVIDIPGAHFVDITSSAQGIIALCKWAKTVRRECSKTNFNIHRYFDNGCELMAGGAIQIERLPRVFQSPCSFHVRFEEGNVAALQFLFDTYALQKFRGEMD